MSQPTKCYYCGQRPGTVYMSVGFNQRFGLIWSYVCTKCIWVRKKSAVERTR